MESSNRLKVTDHIDIRRREIAPVLETVNNIDIRLKQANAENTNKMNMMGMYDDIESLKRVLLEQQKYLESVKKKEVSCNIIISVIPNATLTINEIEVTENIEKLEEMNLDLELLLLICLFFTYMDTPMSRLSFEVSTTT